MKSFLRVTVILTVLLLTWFSDGICDRMFYMARSLGIGSAAPFEPDYFKDNWSKGLQLHFGASYLLLSQLRGEISLNGSFFVYKDKEA